MKKFPQFLKYLLESQRYRLGDLAHSAQVHASDLSKIIGQKRPCGAKMATQVIRGLNEADRTQALVNWLSDQVPSDMAQLVEIRRAGSSEDLCTLKDEPIDNEITKALKFIESEAQTNEPVRKMLLAMKGMFDPVD